MWTTLTTGELFKPNKVVIKQLNMPWLKKKYKIRSGFRAVSGKFRDQIKNLNSSSSGRDQSSSIIRNPRIMMCPRDVDDDEDDNDDDACQQSQPRYAKIALSCRILFLLFPLLSIRFFILLLSCTFIFFNVENIFENSHSECCGEKNYFVSCEFNKTKREKLVLFVFFGVS